MHLFDRDEVGSKGKEDPWRNPQSEEQVRNHHRETINRKKSCDPNGGAAQVDMLRFRRRPNCRVVF